MILQDIHFLTIPHMITDFQYFLSFNIVKPKYNLYIRTAFSGRSSVR